jgi:hypothetical protein
MNIAILQLVKRFGKQTILDHESLLLPDVRSAFYFVHFRVEKALCTAPSMAGAL